MPHFNPPVRVLDEGVYVKSVGAIDFVGAGVAATSGTSDVATITIGGGSGSSTIAPDILANRPSAVTAGAGALYYATDVELLYRSDGATWAGYSITDALKTGDIDTLVASPSFVIAMAASL